MLGSLWMLVSRIWGWLSRRPADEDFARELESHSDMLIQENVRRGMTPEEARRAARVRLGGVTQLQEQHREMHTLPLLETFVQDLRYGLRTLRKSPGFTAVALLTLALGIGANSAIFSVFDSVLLESLPVKKPQELQKIREEARTRTSGRFSYIEFQRLGDASHIPDGMAAMSRVVDVDLRVDGEREQEFAKMQLVSGEYFPVLGVYPARGRMLTPEDNRTIDGHPVAVISGSYWQRRFGGAANVVGQGITLNGAHFTIVGVGPRKFAGVWMEEPVDVWVPLMMQSDVRYAQHYSASGDDTKPWIPQEGIRWLDIILRAKPGAEATMAAGSVNSVYQQWVVRKAETIGDREERKLFLQRKLVLDPFRRGSSTVRREFGGPLFVLMVMVGLVLLIACANIANLLLARGEARQREIAVRLSIGAGRFRLIRQLLVESLLLSTMGAALGLLVAQWSSALLVRMASGIGGGPPLIRAGVDAPVLLFTAGLEIGRASCRERV